MFNKLYQKGWSWLIEEQVQWSILMYLSFVRLLSKAAICRWIYSETSGSFKRNFAFDCSTWSWRRIIITSGLYGLTIWSQNWLCHIDKLKWPLGNVAAPSYLLTSHRQPFPPKNLYHIIKKQYNDKQITFSWPQILASHYDCVPLQEINQDVWKIFWVLNHCTCSRDDEANTSQQAQQ